jgi:hypothetical protein
MRESRDGEHRGDPKVDRRVVLARPPEFPHPFANPRFATSIYIAAQGPP